jgi:mannose-6-phosphate isomerase-like protein (cupin superfamily)
MTKENIKKFDWGYEIVWANNDYYCSKILVFENSEKKIPLHFHKSKNKSWFVNAGKFEVQWVDTEDGKVYAKELPEGSVFEVPALTPVTLKSLSPNSAMAETSNSNDEKDFYRLN